MKVVKKFTENCRKSNITNQIHTHTQTGLNSTRILSETIPILIFYSSQQERLNYSRNSKIAYNFSSSCEKSIPPRLVVQRPSNLFSFRMHSARFALLTTGPGQDSGHTWPKGTGQHPSFVHPPVGPLENFSPSTLTVQV